MTTGNGSNGQTTAIQRKDPKQTAIATFQDYLAVRKKHISDIVPKHLTAERVVKVALTAYSRTPDLMNCTLDSVFRSVMQAAELGLEPGGALGHAYLVPFGKECTLIPGYRGLIELAKRSGEVADIKAWLVHANDKFQVVLGYHEDIIHEPNLENPGELVAAYAIATLPDGTKHPEVMTGAQLDAVRKYSKRLASQHPEEWARKTVIRRLVKYLPLSSEKAELLQKAIEVDGDDNGPVLDVTASSAAAAEKAASRSAAVLNKLAREEPQDVPFEPSDSAEPPADVPLPKPSDSPQKT